MTTAQLSNNAKAFLAKKPMLNPVFAKVITEDLAGLKIELQRYMVEGHLTVAQYNVVYKLYSDTEKECRARNETGV